MIKKKKKKIYDNNFYLENNLKGKYKAFFKFLDNNSGNINFIRFYKNFRKDLDEKKLFLILEKFFLDKKTILKNNEIVNLELKNGKMIEIIDKEKIYYHNFKKSNNMTKLISLENCEFLVLENLDLVNKIKKILQKKKLSDFNFINKSFGFENSEKNRSHIKNLLPLFKEKTIQKNEILISKLKKQKKIYLIKKGQFMISLKIENNFEKNLIEKLSKEKKKIILKNFLNQNIKINICKEFEIVGEEIFFEKNYLYEIICLKNHSLVYEFDISIYNKFNENMKNNIHDILKKKIFIRKIELRKNLLVKLKFLKFRFKKIKNFNFLQKNLYEKIKINKIMTRIKSLEKISKKIQEKNKIYKNKKKENIFLFNLQNRSKTKSLKINAPNIFKNTNFKNNIFDINFKKKIKRRISSSKISNSFSKVIYDSKNLLKAKTLKKNFIIKNYL